MSFRYSFRVTVLAGGLLLGLASSATAALPVDDLRSLAAVRSGFDQGDVLIKPYGWLQFDEICAFHSRFAVTLDRAKRNRGRVIVRNFKGMSGNLYREALPSVLGLDCVPYSVGFD